MEMTEAIPVLRPGEMLTAEAARQRLGVSPFCWRDLKKRLNWTVIGQAKLVRSDQVIQLVETIAEEQMAKTA